jgi:arylsulfatase A-like enzyme
MLRLSYVPGRSGDLLVAYKPFTFLDDGGSVAGHGAPQDYDRRVPLVFWGPWKAERRPEPVRIVDLAPTLAKELGLVPTEPVDGRALTLNRP